MSDSHVLLRSQCPFVGLRPFGYEDREKFFGRDEQIATLEDMVLRKSLISVVGSSGSGKSSLIRAGLLPRLAADGRNSREKWNCVVMRPGDAPVRALAEALTRPNVETGGGSDDPVSEGRANRIEIALQQSSFGINEALAHITTSRKVVILIDQFEEIFRYADLRAQHTTDLLRANQRREESTFFVQLLLAAAGNPEFPGRIILAMRSDFIGDCARFHGLSSAVTESQYLVPALTRDQRADVIRLPVDYTGAAIEPALVQRVLNDTSDDPDQLPVLQHAMMRTWQHAMKGGKGAVPHLRVGDYTEIGGIERAISNHADEILDSLGDEYVVKRVFQSLTDTDALGRAIRRPQRLGELAAVLIGDDANDEEKALQKAAVKRVVNQFADPGCSFLRLPDDQDLDEGAVIDIGHEALIRRWDKLGSLNKRNWVREEQEDAENLNDLVRSARLDQLIPEEQLVSQEVWWSQRHPNRFWASRHLRNGAKRLADAEAVLRRSRTEIELQEARRREEAELQERRRKRRLRIRIGFLVGIVVVACALWTLKIRTEQWAALTQQKAAAQYSAALGTSTLIRDGASGALAFAYKSLQTVPYTPEMEGLIYAGLQRLYEKAIIAPDGGWPALAFRPDGKLYVLTKRLALWDPSTAVKIADLSTIVPPSFYDISVSPDGRYVLIGGNEHTFLLDAAGRNAPLELLINKNTAAGYAVFSPDGGSILTASRKTSPKLWKVKAVGDGPTKAFDLGTIEPRLQDGEAAVAFGRRYLAIADNHGLIYIFNAGISSDLLQLKQSKLFARTSDPAWSRPVVGEGVPKLLQAPSDQNFSTAVNYLEFDPKQPDKLLGLVGGRAFLWTIDDDGNDKLLTLPGQEGQRFFRARFSPDGRWLALHAAGGEADVWSLDNPKQPPIRLIGASGFGAMAFSSDNLVAVGGDNGVWLFGLEPALRFDHGNSTGNTRTGTARMRSAVSADRRWSAAAPQRGALLLFDLNQSRYPITWFGQKDSEWRDVRFATGPNRVIATSTAGQTQEWLYFADEAKLLDFVKGHLPYQNGDRIDTNSICPENVGGTKLSTINPALHHLWPSCK
jgi:WD40 repeat protein